MISMVGLQKENRDDRFKSFQRTCVAMGQCDSEDPNHPTAYCLFCDSHGLSLECDTHQRQWNETVCLEPHENTRLSFAIGVFILPLKIVRLKIVKKKENPSTLRDEEISSRTPEYGT